MINILDVTSQRAAERARQALEARFGTVFQIGPHPIVFARAADGRGMRVNQAWHRLLGYTASDIEDRTTAELGLWLDSEFRQRRLSMLERGEKVLDLEAQMRTKAGVILDVLVSSARFDVDEVPHMVTIITDVTASKASARAAEQLATRDHLTGLPNRMLFADRLQQALRKAARLNTRLALMFIDLDRFKDVNDSLGHSAGDRLLIEASARLSASLRGGDTLARQGGDEFLLLLEDLESPAEAAPVARKLVDALAAPFELDGSVAHISSSIGISVFPEDGASGEELMRNADLAMYSVKESGRDGFRFYASAMNARLQERIESERRLRGALGRGEFVVHYQPKLRLADGGLTGCEALLRWNDPQRGLVMPGQFIALAEETRLIVPIGEWVLRAVCGQLQAWRAAGLAPIPVAVNLSAHQLSAALPELLDACLRASGIPAALLEIEITESVMMENSVANLDVVRGLKLLGVKVSLDDFGTGYSSLAYLRHLDLDTLKIDRSFVQEIESSADDRAIVAAIVVMARQFGMTTVAEGVETSAQAETLRTLGCDEVQGYLYGQPEPAEEFTRRCLAAA